MGKGYNYFDIEAGIEERNFMNAEPTRQLLAEKKRKEAEEEAKRRAAEEQEVEAVIAEEAERKREQEELAKAEKEARKSDPYLIYRVTEGSMYEARRQEGDLPLLELAKRNAAALSDEEESE